MARATAETSRSEVLELTRRLRAAEVEREIETLRSTGLAPSIIDCARPLLELPAQTIKLSNGSDDTVDPAEATREVLRQVVELARSGHAVLDFDVESGALIGSDSVQEARAGFAQAWDAEYGS